MKFKININLYTQNLCDYIYGYFFGYFETAISNMDYKSRNDSKV